MTPDQFLQNFPEFERTSPNVVSGKLAFAAAKMGGPDFSVWPAYALPGAQFTLTDLAQGYLAAHLLQTSPFGGPTRLDPKDTDGRSTYLKEYEDIQLAVAQGGMLVAGSCSTAAPGTAPGAFTLSPGSGTVALTNGSTAVTFSVVQVLPAGTIFAFIGAQPGALYTLYANLSGTVGTLAAPYTGVTTAASSWNYGAG